ncbi:glutathione S-transferase family protein [Massilia sp. BKSP1R2A-1]|uniref:glutathione S-transferase family protein n=1 Tax=Massilia sp. BKSP1R2A-1 TaxID=3422595 RepID=UPI003D342397
MITLTTFRSVPSFAAGYVRDLRVRWALEEAGLPYSLRLLDFEEAAKPAYRKEQPFSQIPMLHDGDLALFESGAILLHLGGRCPLLLPQDANARAQVTVWMFAALNSVEPYLAELVTLDLFHAGEDWVAGARPSAEEMALKRLRDLDDWLEGRDWLAGEFSVADILMCTVLRLLDGMDLVERFARLSAYRDRCMERPAFRKALADQLALYEQTSQAA